MEREFPSSAYTTPRHILHPSSRIDRDNFRNKTEMLFILCVRVCVNLFQCANMESLFLSSSSAAFSS